MELKNFILTRVGNGLLMLSNQITEATPSNNDIPVTNTSVDNTNDIFFNIGSIISDYGLYILIILGIFVMLLFISLLFKRKKKDNMILPQNVKFQFDKESTITLSENESSYFCIGNQQLIGTRKEQQDSFSVTDINDYQEKGFLAVLADGMGGLSNGKLISRSIVQSIIDKFDDFNNNNDNTIFDNIRNTIILSNEKIKEISSSGESGSTLILTYIKNNKLYWASVGDSRIYLLRSNKLYKLNKEHNYKKVLNQQYLQNNINMLEITNNPKINALTSYIGSVEEILIDQNLKEFNLISNDFILLLSDGVYNTLDDDEIVNCINIDPQIFSNKIKDKIDAKYKKNQDNATIIIIKI